MERLFEYSTLLRLSYDLFEHKNFNKMVSVTDRFFNGVKVGKFCVIRVPVDGYIPYDPNDRISDWVPSKWGNVFIGKVVGYRTSEIESSFFKGVSLTDPRIVVKNPDGEKIDILELDVQSHSDDEYAMRFVLTEDILEELYRSSPADVPRDFFFDSIAGQIDVFFTDEDDAIRVYHKWKNEEMQAGKEYLESQYAYQETQRRMREEKAAEETRLYNKSKDEFKKFFK